MYEFPLNMGVIITKEINRKVVRLSTSLSFPCLISQLCREAHVPILAGIDMEKYATKKYYLSKLKNESRYELILHKTILEVFRSSDQTARAIKTITDLAGRATGVELFCHASPIPISTPSTSSAAATQLGVESAEASSAMPQSSEYAFIPANFTKVVRKENIQEKHLKVFAKLLDLFADRAITAALEPYKNLHACIDDMEVRANDRLKDLTIQYLVRSGAGMMVGPKAHQLGDRPSPAASCSEGKVDGCYPNDGPLTIVLWSSLGVP
ncbi:hypothetical protein HAX54_023912 [Datura stramonium]|uniref:Uncharacterized protein n=1 Tax=Datura stramonium TaxID=4076 RepID=A0ABS8UZ37_DATST|nr:hypothetical protein [Datura stramonium]